MVKVQQIAKTILFEYEIIRFLKNFFKIFNNRIFILARLINYIHLFEVTTSFMGALFEIDTYNQPAVELGKEATFALKDKKNNYKPGYTYAQFAEDIRAKTKLDEDFLV